MNKYAIYVSKNDLHNFIKDNDIKDERRFRDCRDFEYVYEACGDDINYFDSNGDFINGWRGLSFLQYVCNTAVEVCSPEDPHIIDENEGVYLIGLRDHLDGMMFEEWALDRTARGLSCKRPTWKECKFSDVVEDTKTCTHEGFVVRDVESGELLLKIKSPYYLTRKFFMRGGDKKWDKLWDNPKEFKKTIDEEYYPVVEYLLTKEKDWWKSLNEQERKQELEKIF